MRGFTAKALLFGAAIGSFACAPQSDPAGVAKRLTEVSREALVAELASTVADGHLSPAFVTFLDGMNAALDGVDDVESAIANRFMLVILADRLAGIDRQRAEPPSAGSREGAERRLAELEAWRQYEANLSRLVASPETVAQISEPLGIMVLFFERQNREI